MQGATQLLDLKVDKHTTYEHHPSICEFQDSLSEVIMPDIVDKVSKSGKFSMMLDESTDISVSQNVIVYIRLLESDCFGSVSPCTYFLGIADLQRANAETIYAKVVDMLGQKGILMKGLCGISTDGAAVMVGNKSGVVTRFKESVPGVLATHCIAHRLALSCCSGADSIPYLVKFQEILNSVYKFFHNSPKKILNVHSRRFKEIFHTRWLSFEGAVDAFVANYASLVSVFLEENSGKALSLHKPITTFKFLYTAHFLCDALKPLAILSKMYQSLNLNFSEVMPLLKTTIERLERLRDEKKGEVLARFLEIVPESPQTDHDGLVTFQFHGHTIRDSLAQRIESDKHCSQFITMMVKSLQERFSNNADGLVLTSLSNFFNPVLKNVEGDIEEITDYLGCIGMEGYRSEPVNFADYAREYHGNGNQSVKDINTCLNLAIRNKEVFPASAEAAERLLVMPISTVDCERGFSRQNLIKTALRNSMSTHTLNNLLAIGINPFPNDKLKDSSKLKEFADDKFKFDEYDRKFSKREENTVGKGEIARYEQFLLFPQCFQKTCTADT